LFLSNSINLLFSLLFGSGGYDSGTSAGKGNFDISLTWNPFNYFKYGQTYSVIGYGITDKLDIHGYYSTTKDRGSNYYAGLFYQFIDNKYLDAATAFGARFINSEKKPDLFLPQLLYTIKINKKLFLGGSFVNIIEQGSKINELKLSKDIFLIANIFDNKKYKIDFTCGAFKPISWKPSKGNWHPTYSIDIKIKTL